MNFLTTLLFLSSTFSLIICDNFEGNGTVEDLGARNAIASEVAATAAAGHIVREDAVESRPLEVHHHHQQQQQQQQYRQSTYPVYYDGKDNYYRKNPASSAAPNAGYRPTLENLREEEAANVNTPEQLLEHCCQFPACYDPLYQLCIDTCRKCETVFPVTSWLPCPPLLNIPDCTSESLSGGGRLPLACYPDIGPFANIMPLSSVMKVSSFYNPTGRGVGVVGGPPSDPSQNEQMYRRSMQDRNRKSCNTMNGVCQPDKTDFQGFQGKKRK